MNRKTVNTLAGVALLSIAGAAVAVYAAGNNADKKRGPGMPEGPGMGFMPPGMMGPHLLHRLGDELELTQAQRDTIKGLLESARPNMQSMREQMRTSAEQLHNTQPDSPNYANVVAQASQKAGEMASRMVTEGSQLRSQVYQVLTTEQRAKLKTLGDNFHDRMENRGMHRRPPPPPEQEGTNHSDGALKGQTFAFDAVPTIEVTAKRI